MAAPGRVDGVGVVGKHGEEVAGREVHLIAFPSGHDSKVCLRKAEERLQHIADSILHILVLEVLWKKDNDLTLCLAAFACVIYPVPWWSLGRSVLAI